MMALTQQLWEFPLNFVELLVLCAVLNSFLIEFTDWVAWKKDPDYKTRKWLMEKALIDYPGSALYSFDLARYALATGDTVLAKAQFRETLSKLPADEDEYLIKIGKDRILESTEKRLKSLD